MILREKLLAASFAASVVINLMMVSALGWSRIRATIPPAPPKAVSPKAAAKAEKRFGVYTPPKPKPKIPAKSKLPITPKPKSLTPKSLVTPKSLTLPKPLTPKSLTPPGQKKPEKAKPDRKKDGARPPASPKPPGGKDAKKRATGKPMPPGKAGKPTPRTGAAKKAATTNKPGETPNGQANKMTPGERNDGHFHAPAATPKARILPKLKLGPKGVGRAKSAAALKAVAAKKAVIRAKARAARRAIAAKKSQIAGVGPGVRNGTIPLPGGTVKSEKPGTAAQAGQVGRAAKVAAGAVIGRTGRAAVGSGVGNEEIGGGDGNGLVGEYYEGPNFERFRAKRADARIEFDWWSKLPVPQMPPATPYSVRWTGLISPRTSGTYTFIAVADDGVRVWINGQKLIDDWQIQPATEVQGSIALTANQKYDIRVEFFEKNGTSISKVFLYWQSARQPREIVPESRLFQGRF